jgi:hypothetical protein
MKRSIQRHPAAIVDDLHPVPDVPIGRPIDGAYLEAKGYTRVGSAYARDGITVVYTGDRWVLFTERPLLTRYPETIEEFERMLTQ